MCGGQEEAEELLLCPCLRLGLSAGTPLLAVLLGFSRFFSYTQPHSLCPALLLFPGLQSVWDMLGKKTGTETEEAQICVLLCDLGRTAVTPSFPISCGEFSW